MGTGNWIDLGIFAGGGFLAAHVGNWLLGLRRRKIGPPRYEAREAPAPFEAFYAADWRGDGCYGEDGCGPTRFLASGHETAPRRRGAGDARRGARLPPVAALARGDEALARHRRVRGAGRRGAARQPPAPARPRRSRRRWRPTTGGRGEGDADGNLPLGRVRRTGARHRRAVCPLRRRLLPRLRSLLRLYEDRLRGLCSPLRPLPGRRPRRAILNRAGRRPEPSPRARLTEERQGC
jgi:hypothetical protein